MVTCSDILFIKEFFFYLQRLVPASGGLCRIGACLELALVDQLGLELTEISLSLCILWA